MRKPQGYAVITSPERSSVIFDREVKPRCEEIGAGMHEVDTASCGHCNRVMHIKPFMDPADMGGLCKICMKFTCPKCVDLGCTPFEKKLELAEKRGRALRSYGF